VRQRDQANPAEAKITTPAQNAVALERQSHYSCMEAGVVKLVDTRDLKSESKKKPTK